jgi:hypothetical protein
MRSIEPGISRFRVRSFGPSRNDDVWIASSPRSSHMTVEMEDSMAKAAKAVGISTGQCLCGNVRFEIDTPARWAWHDHSAASRRAHGAVYATYVGSWRKRFRVTKGEAGIARFEDKATGTARSFCQRCGTPLFYERARSPHMVNIPRALFSGRTRPPAALSCRDRGIAGMGLHRRAAGAAEGLSRRGVATLETQKTHRS